MGEGIDTSVPPLSGSPRVCPLSLPPEGLPTVKSAPRGGEGPTGASLPRRVADRNSLWA